MMPQFSRRIAEQFARIPQGAVPIMTRGFEVLGRLPEKSRNAITIATIEQFGEPGDSTETKRVSEQYGIEFADARDLAVSLSTTIATISNGKEPIEEFVEAGLAKGVLTESIATLIRPVLELIGQRREDIRDALENSSVGAEVLPSLEDFEVTVDLRLKFNDGQVGRTVPVLVVHVDTDAYDQEIWFQMSRAQAKKLLETLDKGVKELDAARAWATSRKERDR